MTENWALERLRLWRDVVEAEKDFDRVRKLPADRSAASIVRADLLAALEAYTACLTAQGRPIPYRLRDELRLHRRTWSGAGRSY